MKYKFKKLAKKDYIKFYNSLKEAREVNGHGLFVLLREPHLFKQTKNFLLGDGVAGFAIAEDGEMISVHKNNVKADEQGIHHILPSLVACGFKNGGLKGDCYGEGLAKYYMSCGFLPVCTVAFDNIPDNPENWDYATFGKPNDYAFIKGVKNNRELAKLISQNKLLKFEDVKAKLPQFDDYNKALAYRDELLNKTKKLPYDEVAKMLYEK